MSGILLQSPQEALRAAFGHPSDGCRDRKSTRLNSSHVFSLLRFFRSSKQGVRQIDYIHRYANTFPDLFQEEPLNIPLLQSGGNRGLIARRGGVMSGILLRSLWEALRAALGHPLDGCRLCAGGTCLQYIVSTIPEALPPQGFISFTNLSCSTFTPYSPLPISPLTIS